MRHGGNVDVLTELVLVRYGVNAPIGPVVRFVNLTSVSRQIRPYLVGGDVDDNLWRLVDLIYIGLEGVAYVTSF